MPSVNIYYTDSYTCRDDVVRVLPGNNGSLVIQAAQQGEAILRVWLHDHTHIDDYIRVRVGFAVTPNMATVHLGTHICFSTHIAEGWWEHDQSRVFVAYLVCQLQVVIMVEQQRVYFS